MTATSAAEREEIADIVRSVVASLHGDLTAADVSLYGELQGLASFIAAAKGEIASIQPHDIRHHHLPTANDELAAVVGATAHATGEILDCVEQIEKMKPDLTPAHAEKVNDLVTRIYEACNFQDITGQRITKVVKTLEQIDHKVSVLLNAFGDTSHPPVPGLAGAAPAVAVAATQPDADLLNGPQLPGKGISQADIDALFGD